jgi:hypothetical protein
MIRNAEHMNRTQSDCTYDRIIVMAGLRDDYAKEAGVFRFDAAYELTKEAAEDVSDHYPVYARFAAGRD